MNEMIRLGHDARRAVVHPIRHRRSGEALLVLREPPRRAVDREAADAIGGAYPEPTIGSDRDAGGTLELARALPPAPDAALRSAEGVQEADPMGWGVPRWVEHDFRDHASRGARLRCGILAHGFARVRCTDCGHERLLAFSPAKAGACARPATPGAWRRWRPTSPTR